MNPVATVLAGLLHEALQSPEPAHLPLGIRWKDGRSSTMILHALGHTGRAAAGGARQFAQGASAPLSALAYLKHPGFQAYPRGSGEPSPLKSQLRAYCSASPSAPAPRLAERSPGSGTGRRSRLSLAEAAFLPGKRLRAARRAAKP